MTPEASLDNIAVRLAHEGVPLAAIARSVGVPSDTLRHQLIEARDDGRLLDMPPPDWPVGSSRDQRALQLSRLLVSDRDALARAAAKIFALTSTEVELLLALLRAPIARRDALTNTMTVHIHHLRRRLARFGIKIETLWGSGYVMPDADRKRALDLIAAAT